MKYFCIPQYLYLKNLMRMHFGVKCKYFHISQPLCILSLNIFFVRSKIITDAIYKNKNVADTNTYFDFKLSK
jgi:hypothetical protein